MNKATYLINWLHQEPLKFSEMNRLMKSIEKNEHGNFFIKEKYRAGAWRNRKDYQGYWNTSLCRLSGGKKPLIKKNAEGRYEVTPYGLENKLHPFATDKKELKRMREFRAERKARFERAKLARPKMVGQKRIIEFIEFENDEYRLIKKVVVQQ